MNAKRINLCDPVRASLIDLGVSTVKVVLAVNASLGELASKQGQAPKLGYGRTSSKGEKYAVTEQLGTLKYEGKVNMPLQFDAWHGLVERAYNQAKFDSISIPEIFQGWLNKMKEDKPQAAPEPVKA